MSRISWVSGTLYASAHYVHVSYLFLGGWLVGWVLVAVVIQSSCWRAKRRVAPHTQKRHYITHATIFRCGWLGNWLVDDDMSSVWAEMV